MLFLGFHISKSCYIFFVIEYYLYTIAHNMWYKA